MKVCGQCETTVSDHEVSCTNCGGRVMLDIGDEVLGGYKGLMNERSSTIVSRVMLGFVVAFVLAVLALYGALFVYDKMR